MLDLQKHQNLKPYPNLSINHLASSSPPPVHQKIADYLKNLKYKKLWNKGIEKDPSFLDVYTSLERGDRALPHSIGTSVQMTDCFFDEKHALVYRGALWILNWEPLRTTLIQKLHDSHMTGHAGREITLSVLS
ncbi:hypothetical protein K3495_g2681 [Podosphaera aphanis]|nr:hypothetical protein K3495_g2681 [Podosphaera aphanis]